MKTNLLKVKINLKKNQSLTKNHQVKMKSLLVINHQKKKLSKSHLSRSLLSLVRNLLNPLFWIHQNKTHRSRRLQEKRSRSKLKNQNQRGRNKEKKKQQKVQKQQQKVKKNLQKVKKNQQKVKKNQQKAKKNQQKVKKNQQENKKRVESQKKQLLQVFLCVLW